MVWPPDEPMPERRATSSASWWARELAEIEACLIATTIDTIRHNAWREDGHTSVRCWLRAVTGWSEPRLSRCLRAARLCIDAPPVLTALARGKITSDRVDVLARAWANPRVRELLVDGIDDFLAYTPRAHQDFELFIRNWVTYADLDGGHRTAEDGHHARHLVISPLEDGTTMLRGELPPALAVQFRAVLDAYVHTEFLADHEHAIAAHGPDVTAAQYPRTHRQRVLDALMHITLDAATHCQQPTTADTGAGDETSDDTDPAAENAPTALRATTGAVERRTPVIEPTVMIHADIATLTKTLELLRPTIDSTIQLHDIGTLTLGQLNAQLAATVDPRQLRAHTGDGTPLPLADILTALLIGKIRVVIEDEHGVITHAGRSRRLFTGPQRDLVLAAATHCIHPGCNRPGNHCQADHLHPHSHGGPTDTTNGGPRCSHHNRWRHQHGYTTTRDPNGTWHTWRPDGTEV